MTENGSEEALLVRAEPLPLAENVCQRMVDVVRRLDGALLLEADLTWMGTINTVLIKKGVRVSEAHPEMRLLPDGTLHCPACRSEVCPVGTFRSPSRPDEHTGAYWAGGPLGKNRRNPDARQELFGGGTR